MFRARERGRLVWPFAISLLALIVMIVLFVGANTEREAAQKSKQQAADDRAVMEKEKNDALTKLQQVTRAAGFVEGNFTTAGAIDSGRKALIAKLVAAMTATYDSDKYTSDPTAGQIEKTSGGKVTVVYLTEAEINDTPTLESFFSKFEVATGRMRRDIDRAFASTAQALADKEALAKADQDALKAKEARIGELTQEKSALDSRMHEQENELKGQIAQKDQQISSKDADAEAARKRAAENEAKLIAQANELQGQVRSLVQREAPQISEGPDGEVILSDNGVAIVNRGKTDWLMPGTVFEVLGRAKGGATYKKGSVKVTNVDDSTARAAILEENARDPITRGDLIQSLTYSPNRQLHFVLVGDFKKMGRSQAEALLKKLGAQVDGKVTSDTNYLVVGATPAGQESLDDSEAVKTAKDFGIKMITEEQLASFARY